MAEVKVRADVSGSIWKVQTSVGATVAEGDELFIIESMKMEIPVTAPSAGVVKTVSVKESDQIEENQVIATLDA